MGPVVMALSLALLIGWGLLALGRAEESDPSPPSSAEAKSEAPADPKSEVAEPTAEPKPQSAPAKPVEPRPIPLELQPYRVRISVAFEDHPSLTVRFRNELLASLAVWIDRTYAQMWQVTIEHNEWLSPANSEGLSRLTWAQVETQLAEKQLDKAFLMCVSLRGSVFQLAGREWDRMTEQLSARQERLVSERRAVVNELGLAISDLFHPLLLIEKLEGRVASVRARAGEFPAGDPAAEQLRKGTFFQPFFLYFNKEHEVQQRQLVPWTYLMVESSDRARGECSTHTGLRVPLGRNTKRMESWAIGVRPTFSETRFRITPHNNPTKPLIGYQVTLFERVMVTPPPPETPPAESAKPDSNAAEGQEQPSAETTSTAEKKPAEMPQPVAQFNKLHELVTDRRGQVVVPVDPQRPLIWLYVSSGGNMLGRFPYIPGLAATITAELPDDSLRLSLESRLELLRAEFIDVVARRALLLARAKAAAKIAEWNRFNEALADLDRQPNLKYFQTQLDAIKVSIAKKAQDKKDKSLEKRIERLCKETAELIEKHLADDKLKDQREELVELRKAEEETAAAGNVDNSRPRANVPKREPAPANQ